MNFYETDMTEWNGYDVSEIKFNTERDYKTQCPVCAEAGNDKSKNNLHVYKNNGGCYCFGCSWTIPSEEQILESDCKDKSELKERKFKVSIKDLEKFNERKIKKEEYYDIINSTTDFLTCEYRGLNPNVCKDLGVRWKIKNGEVEEMYFPATYIRDGSIKISGFKIRKAPKTFYSKGYVGKNNLLGGQVQHVANTLIAVAGEIDLLTAVHHLESVKKYNKTINVVTSLLGEESTAECLKNNFEWVNKHDKIIICMDKDSAGESAFEKIKAIIDNDKLFKANLRYKDLNEYVKNGDASLIAKDVYWDAIPVEDYGVIGSGELLNKAKERLNQDKIPFPQFLSDLASNFTDNAMWTGEWMNWISSVSSGKSTVMDAWMIDWALNAPYRQAILSYEADSTSFGVKVASLATSRSVMKIEGKENRLEFIENNESEINKLLLTEDGRHRFDFVDKLPSSVDSAKKLINYLVKVRDVKILWIDPCVDFLSICKNKNEYDDLILFLDRVRMENQVTIMTAMHTRKNLSSGQNGSSGGEINEEDAYGGREVISKGTINITAQRNKNAECPIERNTMKLIIRKNRNDQVTGVETKLFYRSKANKLYPYSYAEAHSFFSDDLLKSVEDIDVDDVGFSLKHSGVSSLDEIIVDGDEVGEEKPIW